VIIATEKVKSRRKKEIGAYRKIFIEIINNKARHYLIDAKCRWCSDQLDGAVSFRESLGQTKVMQIHQRETQNHQGAITHEVRCLSSQLGAHRKFFIG